MTWGRALLEMEAGGEARRSSWAEEIRCVRITFVQHKGEKQFRMDSAKEYASTWEPSASDMDAEDWVIVKSGSTGPAEDVGNQTD